MSCKMTPLSDFSLGLEKLLKRIENEQHHVMITFGAIFLVYIYVRWIIDKVINTSNHGLVLCQ